jgi:protein-S-isoprenylcysteine O-methyltransferase Ste14
MQFLPLDAHDRPRTRREPTAAMTMTFKTESQNATSAPESPPFRFAPTFIIDFIFSLTYVVLFMRAWARASDGLAVGMGAGCFAILLALCYAGKVYIIGFLNQRGGDARTYVISSDLVTTGLYAYSRNPTYLLTLVQCCVWSGLLVFLQFFAPFEPIVFAVTMLLPVAFFLITDLWIIRREDAALRAAHPQEFGAYSARVGRWFGARRDAGAA